MLKPSRRTVLAGSAAALAVPALTARAAQAAGPLPTGTFAYGVASGEPTATAVIIWTRVTPDASATPGSGLGKDVAVIWQVAGDEGFTNVVAHGTATATAAADHTVKVDVLGLSPYTRYFYRFTALGKTSPVGQTQTMTDTAGHALRLGLVTCSNFTGGYFSAYRHLAARTDLDAFVHLGDYIYEYGNGADRYGPSDLAGKRDAAPDNEILALADYRKRYAIHRADPDLAGLHQRLAMFHIFDDHEVCDNSYDGGGVNHQPATEGDFYVRRQHAYQAMVEWLPIRVPDQSVPHKGTRFFRGYSFGPLADLTMNDTRQNRSQQVDGAASAGGASLFAVKAAIDDPTRVMMEPDQLAWTKARFATPGTQWRLWANQVVFAPFTVAAPPAAVGSLLATAGLLPANGVVFNPDQWDGYGYQQGQLVQHFASGLQGDVVVLTGDIHCSFANDLPSDAATYVPAGPLNNSVGVEMVVPSITSDGFYELAGNQSAGATALTTAFQASNRHIRFAEGIHHGFCVLDVTPARVQCDWWYVSDREDPQATVALGASWQTLKGSKQLSQPTGQIGARSDSAHVLGAKAVASKPGTKPASRPTKPVKAPAGALAATGLDATPLVVGAAGLVVAAAVARKVAEAQ